MILITLNRACGKCSSIKLVILYVCNVCRLLKDAVQDPAWGRRYERVLGALLCLCGVKLRAELEKQSHLVTLLGAVAERVRQAGSSTRQVSVCLVEF